MTPCRSWAACAWQRALALSPAHADEEGWQWTTVGARPQRQACEPARLGRDLMLIDQDRTQRTAHDLGLNGATGSQLRAQLDGVIVQIQPALCRFFAIDWRLA